MAEPASSQSNTRKLDAILQRLEGTPTVEDWHEMASVISEVSTTVKGIDAKVKKLDEVVIIGNGKPPLNQRVHDLEKDVAGYNKLTWIVIGALVPSIIGIFIFLANTHTLP